MPFLYDDLAYPHPQVRKAFVDEALNSVDLAVKVGADDLIIHPGDLSRNQLPDVKPLNLLKLPRSEYLQNSLSSLKKIVRYNKLHEVNLLVENLPYGLCDTSREVEEFLSELEELNFILDVGHAHVSGKLDGLLELHPTYLHLHDNCGNDDDHLRLGGGNLNFSDLFKKVLARRGEKKMTLELYSVEDIVRSLEFMRDSLGRI